MLTRMVLQWQLTVVNTLASFPHLCCCLQFLIVVFKYQGGRPVRCCGSEASGIQKAYINENNELYWRCLVALWMFLSPVLGQTVQERSSRIFIRHLFCVSTWQYLASLHVTKFPSTSFGYCQQSNSGCNEALGTRLLVSIVSVGSASLCGHV